MTDKQQKLYDEMLTRINTVYGDEMQLELIENLDRLVDSLLEEEQTLKIESMKLDIELKKLEIENYQHKKEFLIAERKLMEKRAKK